MDNFYSDESRRARKLPSPSRAYPRFHKQLRETSLFDGSSSIRR